MSVEVVTGRRAEKAWKVRYRDHGGNARAETYSVENDARLRDAAIKHAKQRKEPLPAHGHGDGGESFEDFAARVWWIHYVEANKRAFKTCEQYSILLDNHLCPLIGGDAIAFIDVPRSLALRSELAATGAPDYTRARALKLFRQIMGFAVLMGKVSSNPGDIFRERGALPPQKRKEDVRPLSPAETEAIRAAMIARKTPLNLRDAVLVSVMAYAGLRPMEALALRWKGIGEEHLRIEVAKSKEGVYKPRTVPKLIRPLLGDLAQWRERAPDTRASKLVFPAENGGTWTRAAYASWRARTWKATAPDDSTPYDLRHGYAVMLSREGVDIADAAERMGHSPAMHVQHYTSLLRAHRERPPETLESAVLKARG